MFTSKNRHRAGESKVTHEAHAQVAYSSQKAGLEQWQKPSKESRLHTEYQAESSTAKGRTGKLRQTTPNMQGTCCSPRTGQESRDKSWWDSDLKFCYRGSSDPAQTIWSLWWNESGKQQQAKKLSSITDQTDLDCHTSCLTKKGHAHPWECRYSLLQSLLFIYKQLWHSIKKIWDMQRSKRIWSIIKKGYRTETGGKGAGHNL